MNNLDKISVVIPAAGIGLRMGNEIPKQYMMLKGQTILAITLSRFLSLRPLELVVVVGAEDTCWQTLPGIDACRIVTGGRTRAESVLNGLKSLQNQHDGWVMVHDAARPCILAGDILSLAGRVVATGTGGLLAVPVVETVKKVVGPEVVATLDRNQIFLAQTPQMYRISELTEALERSIAMGEAITDEASAMEFCGYRSLVVHGSVSNIKVTNPEDMALAGFYLGLEDVGSRQ